MNDYFFPKLEAVEALAPYQLRTTWNTGEVLAVGVGDILAKIRRLRPSSIPRFLLVPISPSRVAALSGSTHPCRRHANTQLLTLEKRRRGEGGK